MANDPKDKPADKSAESAKARIDKQRDLKDALSGHLTAGRLAASTETVTRAKVAAQNEVTKPGAPGKRAAIPPPARPRVAPGPRRAPAAPPPPKKLTPPPPKPMKSQPSASQAAPPPGAKRVAWDPRKIRQFMSGLISLGELEGISKEEQYAMAKVGYHHLRQGKLSNAEKVFRGLVALDPRDAYFHLALGSVAQQTGDLPQAEREYSRSIELNPFTPHGWANRGEIRMMLGRMVEGAKDLMRAMEEDPSGKEACTKRARTTIGVIMAQLQGAEAPAEEAPAPPRKSAPQSAPPALSAASPRSGSSAPAPGRRTDRPPPRRPGRPSR